MTRNGLDAEKQFWALPIEKRQGRCGPGTGFWERIVPDKLFGLTITPACSIHDFDFEYQQGHAGFLIANRRFLNNMYRLISYQENKWLNWPRRWLARFYFRRVNGPVGALIFWDIHND